MAGKRKRQGAIERGAERRRRRARGGDMETIRLLRERVRGRRRGRRGEGRGRKKEMEEEKKKEKKKEEHVGVISSFPLGRSSSTPTR